MINLKQLLDGIKNKNQMVVLKYIYFGCSMYFEGKEVFKGTVEELLKEEKMIDYKYVSELEIKENILIIVVE